MPQLQEIPNFKKGDNTFLNEKENTLQNKIKKAAEEIKYKIMRKLQKITLRWHLYT